MQRRHPILCLFVLNMLLWPWCSQAALAPGVAAQIVSVQGQGQQRPAQDAPWQAARTSTSLAGGAFVRTLADSKMALLFADDTQLRLNQNAMLQVKTVAGAQQDLSLQLLLGRVWAQTKRPTGSRLEFETPAATAGIRGTDWELDVDASGKTMLTVFSGSVEFFNAQGRLLVGSNEAAVAEVGRAPVKIVLSNPRERIQWVNALSADPLRHLDPTQIPLPLQSALTALRKGDLSAAATALAAAQLAPATWHTVLAASHAVLSGNTLAARQQLTALLLVPGALPGPAYLLLSDLQLMDGAFDLAAHTMHAGLQHTPNDPDLLAQLARAQMLGDQLADSATTLARARRSDTASLLLAQGDLARRQGQTPAALQAYTRSTQVAPGDDRGWFGLGSAQNEIELGGPARANLHMALSLNPNGAGYRGELGTLETFANRFTEADEAFALALSHHAADYVALTGVGLLRLKQGQPEAALDAFLRAGVMEPRYARAKAYTAVAYYQLRRHDDAIEALAQASMLDDKDPIPYLFLSQIYTDLRRPGAAVQAAHDAVQRLPYLKSLNQLANDQKGSANFGAALAFFGLEDWALELARRSAYPYWGGSHLFMADRLSGEFNKNSELFQGFLTDPLAFGVSNRFSPLLQSSGHFGTLGLGFDHGQGELQTPELTLNGLSHLVRPMAYFVQLQPAKLRNFPLDLVSLSGQPLVHDPTGRSRADANVGTLGLGLQLTERLGVFAYHNTFGIDLRGNNQVVDLASTQKNLSSPTQMKLDTSHSALGMSYRWTPTSQTWLKLGQGRSFNQIKAYPTVLALDDVVGEVGVYATPSKTFQDLQWRHTTDLSPATRIGLGFEQVREAQDSLAWGSGVVASISNDGFTLNNVLVFAGSNNIRRSFSALSLNAQHWLSPSLLLDGALASNRVAEKVKGERLLVNLAAESVSEDQVQIDQVHRVLTPRLGLVYQPNEQFSLRAAYQDWLRPLSVSTLDRVDTAGIALDDRLLTAGGRVKRSVLQLGWSPNASTFFSAKLDHQDISNPVASGVDLRTPSLPFLEALRNAQTINLSAIDLLENTPETEMASLDALSVGVNRLINPRLSAYLKYIWQDSRNSYADAQVPGGRVAGKRIAFLPRDTLALGTHWAAGQHLQLGARVVYRSDRFEDMSNLTLWPAAWQLDLLLAHESPDKHWSLTAAALNLGGNPSPRQSARYVVDARYRF